ncbi:MAG: LPS assembly lipoprotein LptE [Rhizomicrobium sp.]
MKPALALAALLILPLTGCGFHPLYAVPGQARGQMQAELQSVYVEPVGGRLGYELRDQTIDVIDGTADASQARYRLSLTLDQKSEAIGVQSQKIGSQTQTVTTRYNDLITVQYELTDIKSGAMLTRGTEIGLASYNVLTSPYATLISQQDADKQATDDIADRIRIGLAAFFAKKK